MQFSIGTPENNDSVKGSQVEGYFMVIDFCKVIDGGWSKDTINPMFIPPVCEERKSQKIHFIKLAVLLLLDVTRPATSFLFIFSSLIRTFR